LETETFLRSWGAVVISGVGNALSSSFLLATVGGSFKELRLLPIPVHGVLRGPIQGGGMIAGWSDLSSSAKLRALNGDHCPAIACP
jgi:hypothetical protein